MNATVDKLIEERLKALWNSTPIAFDNIDFKAVRGESFIRLTITGTDSELTSGDALTGNYREHGFCTVQVFTPFNSGARINATMATAISTIFRGYQVDRLYMGAPRVNRVGQSQEWFQTNVLTDFYYDNCIALEA